MSKPLSSYNKEVLMQVVERRLKGERGLGFLSAKDCLEKMEEVKKGGNKINQGNKY